MTTPQPAAPAPNPTVRGVHLPSAGARFGKKPAKKQPPAKKPAPKPAPKRGGGKR